MMRALSLAAFGVAAGLVSAAFFTGGFPWPGAACLLLFVVWIAALWRGWDWFHTPGLMLIFGLIAAGLFLDLEPALLYPGALLSLGGWDLANFDARLRLAGPADDLAGLQKRHLRRLGLTLGAGAGLLLLALVLDLRLPLGWMAVLAIVAVWGLGRLVKQLLQKG
jgi:hypothetical protein